MSEPVNEDPGRAIDWPLLLMEGQGCFCGVHRPVWNRWTEPKPATETWWYGQWNRVIQSRVPSDGNGHTSVCRFHICCDVPSKAVSKATSSATRATGGVLIMSVSMLQSPTSISGPAGATPTNRCHSANGLATMWSWGCVGLLRIGGGKRSRCG